MPPEFGGEVGATAMKLLQNSIWTDVPQPEVLAELVVRALRGNDKAKSGLRGAIQVLRTTPKRERVVEFLEHTLRRA